MHFIDNVHFIFPDLRRNAYLFDQCPNVVHAIVWCRIEFVDVIRALFVECHTRFTCVACFMVCSRMKAVDRFCKNTCTCGFPDSTRAAEQISMCQFVAYDGIFQGCGQCFLPDNRTKCAWTIFSCRYNVIIHAFLWFCKTQIYKIIGFLMARYEGGTSCFWNIFVSLPFEIE